MRSFLLSLAGFAFLLAAAAQGQTPLSQQKIRDELKKNGIELREDEDVSKKFMVADVFVKDADTLKAFGLLRFVKDLTTVSLTIEDVKYAKDSLATLKTLSQLKDLYLQAKGLGEAELRGIASFVKLERLSLVCLDLTDADLKILRDLRNAKSLRMFFLSSAAISRGAEADLKLQLAQVTHFDVYRVPGIFVMEPLEITAKDDLAAKLQKQKLNAAVASLTNLKKQIEVGKITYSDQMSQFIDCLRNLKNAAVDLNDPILTPKVLDDYVQIAANAHRESYHQFEAGKLDPYKYHAFAYEYADAQLFQLRRQQQLDKKAAK